MPLQIIVVGSDVANDKVVQECMRQGMENLASPLGPPSSSADFCTMCVRAIPRLVSL
jgi:hypothetical protein